jgi:hypothetical protein
LRKFKITLNGGKLLMHNGRLALPIDPSSRRVAEAVKANKASQTDASFDELARAEFMGGLYYLDGAGPCWPSDNLHTALKKAGAKRKKTGGRGTLKNAVAAAILFDTEMNPLTYKGFGGQAAPRDADDLWKDGNYRLIKPARVGTAKVPRCRPLFQDWSFEIAGTLDTEILDFEDFRAVVALAGQIIGLGDWRPERGGSYGKFSAKLTDLGEYDPIQEVTD